MTTGEYSVVDSLFNTLDSVCGLVGMLMGRDNLPEIPDSILKGKIPTDDYHKRIAKANAFARRFGVIPVRKHVSFYNGDDLSRGEVDDRFREMDVEPKTSLLRGHYGLCYMFVKQDHGSRDTYILCRMK